MANERLSADQKQRIHHLHGSAENLDDLIQPFTKAFDHILCIDSAYHYNTRWDFFKSAFKYLKDSGGTLGLFDFTLHPALFQSLKQSSWKLYAFKTLCNFIHVPSDNLLATPEEYKQKLYDAGFKNVQLETVATEHVFDGLSRFMRQQLLNASKYGINVSLSDKLFLCGACFVFNLLAKNDWLTPLLVSAEKQESAP
ncbi:hypothetical protein G6F46_001770 [Rhizopus delemar]|nr:hypothetical protein G6F43_000627 [Rhizopus delemar]KAG1550996.1 hypothetical protein G6F51_002107 [Rhizopus arrhizus]KAG1465466.1 hypothetical protein G6F55_001109 [Rhizopus delemar]KAG1503661.1 hypothetical protein G6F54_001518 [Rhizopus delemar]KAG1517074.1 hypothetical protein G6F53_001667 [Rhizopus delemar]